MKKIVGDFLQSFILRPVSRVNEVVVNFFDTSPDMMSDDVAEKLKDRNEAKKLMEEVKRERLGAAEL